MKLLKLIIVVFLIYFIRRLFQFVKVMKNIQASQAAMEAALKAQARAKSPPDQKDNAIDAEFKIVER
jgi:hypothetical protein